MGAILGLSPCGTHWVSAVVVIAVVEVEGDVIVLVVVEVAVVVSAIWHQPAEACYVSQQRQGRAGLNGLGPRLIRRAGGDQLGTS